MPKMYDHIIELIIISLLFFILGVSAPFHFRGNCGTHIVIKILDFFLHKTKLKTEATLNAEE